jgi:hypothetical protein
MEAVSAATNVDERQPDKRLALLIASWEYHDPGFSKLRAPGQDAERLARVLMWSGLSRSAFCLVDGMIWRR